MDIAQEEIFGPVAAIIKLVFKEMNRFKSLKNPKY